MATAGAAEPRAPAAVTRIDSTEKDLSLTGDVDSETGPRTRNDIRQMDTWLSLAAIECVIVVLPAHEVPITTRTRAQRVCRSFFGIDFQYWNIIIFSKQGRAGFHLATRGGRARGHSSQLFSWQPPRYVKPAHDVIRLSWNQEQRR